MKKITFALATLAVATFVGSANAATSNASLTVTGTIVSSISLTVEAAGGTTSGLGTAAATSGLGNIAKFSAAPTGFTLAQGANDWTLSSTIGVNVEASNITSADYTLTSQLATAPATGIVWKMNGSALNDATPTQLTAAGTYGATANYSWDIVIADTAAAGAIDNTIDLVATSN